MQLYFLRRCIILLVNKIFIVIGKSMKFKNIFFVGILGVAVQVFGAQNQQLNIVELARLPMDQIARLPQVVQNDVFRYMAQQVDPVGGDAAANRGLVEGAAQDIAGMGLNPQQQN